MSEKDEILQEETPKDQEQTLYSMKRAQEITGLSADEIRNWEGYFNLQIPRTKGGQRRYTLENLEQLKTIKDKIEENGWGINDAIDWWNGNDTEVVLKSVKIRTDLEKEVAALREMIEKQNETIESQTNFLKSLPDMLSQKVIDDFQNKLSNGDYDDIIKLRQLEQKRIERIAAPEELEPTTKEVKKLNFVQKLGAKLLGLDTEKRG